MRARRGSTEASPLAGVLHVAVALSIILGPVSFVLPLGPTAVVGGTLPAEPSPLSGTTGGVGPYTYSSVVFSSEKACCTLDLADDDFVAVALPWRFIFYGTAYYSVFVSSNGFMSFGTGYVEPVEPFLPTSDYEHVIALFWDDLDPTSAGSVRAGVSSDPNVFIVEWRDVPHFGDPASKVKGEVKLFRDGVIEFHYSSVSDIQWGYTAGINKGDGLSRFNFADLLAGTKNLAFSLTPGLIADDPYWNTASPGLYNYVQNAQSWAAVGLRSDADYDLELFDDSDYTSLVTASSTALATVEFVAVDHNSGPLGSYFPRVTGASKNPYVLEYDPGGGSLVIGPNGPYAFAADEVIEVWDLYLWSSQVYVFTLLPSASCDFGLALFPPLAGPFASGRSSGAELFIEDSNPAGSLEKAATSASVSGWYGLVVFSTGCSADGSFTLDIETLTVDWVVPPANPMFSGSPFQMTWNVTAGPVGHTDVHASDDPDPLANPLVVTNPQSGPAGAFQASMRLDCTPGSTYYIAAHAVVLGVEVSTATVARTCEAAPGRVTWWSVPTGVLYEGIAYEFQWMVNTTSPVNHTDIHYGHDPAFGEYNWTPSQGGPPGVFVDAIVADCTAATVYVRAHAGASGTDLWSPDLAFACEPLPTLTANLVEDVSSGTEPLFVNFSCTATGGVPPYTFLIDYGDGASDSGSTASHVYTSAGTYAVVCTATDTMMLQSSANLTISVSHGPPSMLLLTPLMAEVLEGDTLTLAADVLDSAGHSLGTTVNWTVTGSIGTVAPSQGPNTTFTAFLDAGGTGGTVEASSGSLVEAVRIIVTRDISALAIDPSSAIVPEGSAVTFQAKDGQGRPVAVLWGLDVPIGILSPAVGSTTELTAVCSGGMWGNLTATEPSSGLAASVTVTVVKSSEPATLRVEPSSSQVFEGAADLLTVTAISACGDEFAVAANWTISPGLGGLSPSSGTSTTFASDVNGGGRSGNVTASFGALSTSVPVEVLHGPPELVVVSPSPANVTEGAVEAFVAMVADPAGHDITGFSTITWSVAGGIGTVIPVMGSSTTFEASACGGGLSGEVRATAGTAVGSVDVSVFHETALLAGTFSPSTADVVEAQTQSFVVTMLDSCGHDVSSILTLSWALEAGLGSLATAGPSALFTADGYAGGLTGTLTATHGAASAVAQIAVTHEPPFTLTVEPSSIVAEEGSSAAVAARLIDSRGHNITAVANVTWSLVGSVGHLSETYGPSTTFLADQHSGGNGGSLRAAARDAVAVIVPVIVLHMPMASVAVIPGNVTLAVGDSFMFHGRGFDEMDHPLPQSSFVWSLNGSAIALVESGVDYAVVTAVEPGQGWIRAASNSVVGLGQVQVLLEATAGFLLQVTPSAVSAVPGSTIAFEVYVSAAESFTSSVSLRASSASGVTLDLSNATVSPPSLVVLSLGIPSEHPDGTIRVDVTGTSGSLQRSVELIVQVSATAAVGGPYISHTPPSFLVLGQPLQVAASVVYAGPHEVWLHYKEPGAGTFVALAMASEGDLYVAEIPAQAEPGLLRYYLEVRTGVDDRTYDPLGGDRSPYAVELRNGATAGLPLWLLLGLSGGVVAFPGLAFFRAWRRKRKRLKQIRSARAKASKVSAVEPNEDWDRCLETLGELEAEILAMRSPSIDVLAEEVDDEDLEVSEVLEESTRSLDDEIMDLKRKVMEMQIRQVR